jgi:hypothetical protein
MLSTLVSIPILSLGITAYNVIGLFAPSAGQHLRDEQRRRRSQYDRGTSLAEQEEYGLDLQPWSGPRSCKRNNSTRSIEH